MDTDPQLAFADDGSLRSGRFGDIYYSLQDGLAEARAVFLRGCHLPGDWVGWEDFSVLELGFGTGLNIAALMQLWAAHRPSEGEKTTGHLHVFSVEGFIMSADEAGRALAAWPELSEFAAALLAQWPKARRGYHYMDFPQWGVSLTLALMDVGEALAAWEGRADAIFLDGFSPALNPAMWGKDVLDAVAARARAGARLATFTVAGHVRRGLEAAGFMVRKCPGFGRKRERLEALFTPNHGSAIARRPAKIAIVGAGIAGCALAWQARLLGLAVDVFDGDGPGAGASGNAAALVTPRLDAGDNAISHLYADAFAYSAALYRRLCPEAIFGQGVHQAEMAPKDASRFARIVGQAAFAPGDLSLYGPGDCADMPQSQGIRLNTALWVRPDAILRALLGDQPAIRARIIQPDGRHVRDEEGGVHGPYDAVILACGDGIFDIADHRARYDLRAVRGQVEQVTAEPLVAAASWGGYAVPLPDGFIFGATHERDDRGTEVREADRARNLASLALAMPERAEAVAHGEFTSRAAIRVMTRDYLPVIGKAENGTWLLTGLGARGFCLAPLLARALLAQVLDAPPALPSVAEKLLKPSRLIAPARA